MEGKEKRKKKGGKKREKEERERARARARARAEAQARAEERAWEARWAEHGTRQLQRPERPLVLQAPPIGCDEHPNGTTIPCGPCGTRAEYREKWLAEQKYMEQLSLFEEMSEEVVFDDEPF